MLGRTLGQLEVIVLSSEAEQSGDVVFVGRLTAVDLDTRIFGVRDDAGNRLSLEAMVDADAAATLVGRRVRARGVAVRDARGSIMKLTEVTMEAAPLPHHWRLPEKVDTDALIAAAPGPDPAGCVNLSDEEHDSVIRAVRG